MDDLKSAVITTALSKLARSEISGVNAHTLAVALERAEHETLPLSRLSERQVAIALLERTGYPETLRELLLFLNTAQLLTAGALVLEEITDQHAVFYIGCLPQFLEERESTVTRNARFLLRWLVAHRQLAVAADQSALDGLRRMADDSTQLKNAAYIAYALGMCGVAEDYDRVIHQAELVIEHDREHLDLIADGLYHLHPPALINALQFFLEHTEIRSKQFMTGIHLLAKVSEIEDRAFWMTYYDVHR